MSPSRRRGRHQPVVHRVRGEVAVAVAGSAAVVLGTILLIWLLRPGSSSDFTGGGGGLLHRQPRMGWLVFVTLAALIGIVAWVRRPRTRPGNERVAGAVATVVVVVAAVLAAVLWPHGILRHYQSLTPITTPPITTPTTHATVTVPTSRPGTTTPVRTTAPTTGAPTTARTTAAPSTTGG